ncbi:hypothetical protein SEA_JAMZY_65 [Gordonia phage Jamzy]|nr:hypothetical protein SEA_JAMZY_65 [Gordonia phage Jamzy]
MDKLYENDKAVIAASAEVAMDMGLHGFPHEAFAKRLQDRLRMGGWSLSQHGAPMTPQMEGAIELGHMKRMLTETAGFNDEEAFTLLRDMFRIGVLGAQG